MQKYLFPIILFVAAVSLIVADYRPRSTAHNLYTQPTNIFHVKDGSMFGNDGQPIWLSGINIGQWLVLEGYLWGLGPHRLQTYEYNYAEYEIRAGLDWVLEHTNTDTHDFLMTYRESFMTQEDIAYLKSLGFNLIRVPFHTKDFDAYFQDGDVRDIDFTYLDRAVRWCEAFEVYCLLDLHAAPKAQSTLPHSDSAGTADFWEDQKVQEKTAAFWGVLAKRYHNNTWIAGFDLLNEPQAPNDRVLNEWYEMAIAAIRETGNQHVLFVQPNNITLDIESVLQADTGIVYAPHYYGFGGRLISETEPFFAMLDQYNVPAFIGELGNWANDRWAKYSDHFTLYRFASHGVPYAYWNYKDMIADNQSSFGIVRGKLNPAFDQFARAIESEQQLPADFDVPAFFASFASAIPSEDRSDVVALLVRSMPDGVLRPLTDASSIDASLSDRYRDRLIEFWQPYAQCADKTVRECFDLP